MNANAKTMTERLRRVLVSAPNGDDGDPFCTVPILFLLALLKTRAIKGITKSKNVNASSETPLRSHHCTYFRGGIFTEK